MVAKSRLSKLKNWVHLSCQRSEINRNIGKEEMMESYSHLYIYISVPTRDFRSIRKRKGGNRWAINLSYTTCELNLNLNLHCYLFSPKGTLWVHTISNVFFYFYFLIYIVSCRLMVGLCRQNLWDFFLALLLSWISSSAGFYFAMFGFSMLLCFFKYVLTTYLNGISRVGVIFAVAF